MPKLIIINAGEAIVDHDDTKIKTSSIGSCMVIALYDDKVKIGGLAHAMLPCRKNVGEEKIDETPAKYVDEAIDYLMKKIEEIGGKKENTKAKLVGGARMFKILSGDKFGIGQQNIETAQKRLEELGILIESEDTGGTIGRLAEMDLENGIVEVITKM